MHQLDVTPEDYEKAKIGSWWDIEKLREFFTCNVPMILQRDCDGAKPPFPLHLVSGITEDQIASLQSIFNVPDGDMYYCWCKTYLGVNLGFLESGQRGADIVRVLRNTVPVVDLPEVFFLLAYAYLINDKKGSQFQERNSGLWAQLNLRAQTNAKALEKVIDQLIHVVDLADEGDQRGRSKLMLPEVSKWFQKHGLKELLIELLEVTQKDRMESQRIFEDIYANLKEDFPSNKVETTPDAIYQAFDRVASLLSKYKGRKTLDIKGTHLLFHMWELIIDDSALRMARKKRK